jgi:glucosamine-6-phosphate deaminase
MATRPAPRLTFRVDQLSVEVYVTRAEMGQAAAYDALAALERAQYDGASPRAIFAAAPSQNELLAGLRHGGRVDWRCVHGFHMDEYLGLPPDAPQSFGRFLRERLFGELSFGSVRYLDGQTTDPAAECARYAVLLAQGSIDLVCAGIGENGHMAFNDPPVADFHDPALVKVVALDGICRQQQVNDGAFAALEQVPTHAITLTMPALLSARRIVCVVPGPTKAQAVEAALTGPIDEACPASALRRHPHAVLYLDRASAARII